MKDRIPDIKNLIKVRLNRMVEKSTEAHKPTQQELEDIFREGDNMDAEERQNMISVLEWRTNFSYEYLKSLTDEQLDKLYKERVG